MSKIKPIWNEIDITVHPPVQPLIAGFDDALHNRSWRHNQDAKKASDTQGKCMTIVYLSITCWIIVSFKMMYVL